MEDIIRGILIAAPLGTVCFFAVAIPLKRSGRIHRISAWTFLFTVYLFVLLYGTIIGRIMDGSRFGMLGNMELYVAFHFDTWASILHDGLNVALFAPYGFLLPLCLSRCHWAMRFMWTLISGIMLTMMIETMQYLLGMSFDLKDMITNIAGLVVGLIFYGFFSLVAKKD